MKYGINKEIKLIGFGTVCIYYDCDYMDHVVSIKETVKLENLIIRSKLSNIVYIYNTVNVEIKNCKLISETQNGINIFDSGIFIIKNCHIEAKKNGVDYNNVLNVFNHSGRIEKCSIYASNYSIKLVNHSNLYIIDTLLESVRVLASMIDGLVASSSGKNVVTNLPAPVCPQPAPYSPPTA